MPAVRRVGDRGGELADAAGAEPRVGREEHHRVVAPAVDEPERRRGGARRSRRSIGISSTASTPRRTQVLDDGRMRERRDRAAQADRHLRVQHRERPHRHLVDQPAGAEQRRGGPARRGQGGRPPPSASGCAVSIAGIARRGELRGVGEGPVERDGVGIDEELRRIEPQPARGRIGAVGAQPVAARRLRRPARSAEKTPSVPRSSGDPLDLALAVEEAEPDALRRSRPDGETQAVLGRGGPERRGRVGDRGAQVMTSGAARPVRSRMPASASAAAIRSASASAVSRSRRSGPAS